jgi:formate hydrogenlyase subunit 6/NADH:ubiquinone oxidoreductase subunit I
MSYFGNIKRGIKTTAKGMSLTLKHLVDARFSRAEKQITDTDFFSLDKGHVTIQYPHQKIDIPDHGRNQLDCEIDDCIVCDKCAKICPVDCIEIEAIKSPELIRTTSDGSPVRLHAAKFDIDLAKCCFCGLCTTVCPTECLTMNSEYDYSVVDVTQLNFAFSNLTEEVAQEKRELYKQFVAEKEALKAEKPILPNKEETKPRPVFGPTGNTPKPVFKPAAKLSEGSPRPIFTPTKKIESESAKPAFKPTIKPTAFKPGMKPAAKSSEEIIEQKAVPVFKPTAKPAFVPSVKPVEVKAKPAFRPGMKPAAKPNDEVIEEKPKADFVPTAKPTEDKVKPVFRPGMKPVAKPSDEASEEKPKPAFIPTAKPAFRPGMKPVSKPVGNTSEEKQKPVFKPTLKPKKD